MQRGCGRVRLTPRAGQAVRQVRADGERTAKLRCSWFPPGRAQPARPLLNLSFRLAWNASSRKHPSRSVPHLGEGAAIFNTGSVTGIEGSPGLVDYSTTKGAIHTFTRSLSENLLQKGIRGSAVAPGPIWTPLNPSDVPPGKVAKFGASVPMGRPAQPEERAPAYVFLAAPSCSSYITGEILPVIGGYS